MQPYDYATPMANAMQLVPDYGAQLMNDLKKKLMHAQIGQLEAESKAAETKAKRTVDYRDAMSRYLANPTAQGLAQLIGDFPEFSKESTDAFKAMDGAAQKSTLTQIGEIASLASSGNYARAAEVLGKRIQAERAAGQEPDPQDEYIQQGLASNDPKRQREALGLLTYGLGVAVGPEHAASFLKSQGMSKEPELGEVDGIVYDKKTGEALLQSPYPKVIPGENGSFFEIPRVSNIPVFGGGGFHTPGIGDGIPGNRSTDGGVVPERESYYPERKAEPAAKPQAFNMTAATNLASRYGKVTSTARTPAHNEEVGGVNNSYHLTTRGGRAMDVARKKGVTHATVEAALKKAGFTLIESIDEGDHSHFAFAGEGGGQEGGPPRVRSVQEAMALPKGTVFITPDGRQKVR